MTAATAPAQGWQPARDHLTKGSLRPRTWRAWPSASRRARMSDVGKANDLKVAYDPATRPVMGYPALLAGHLIRLYGLKHGALLLDLASGRGERLRAFAQAGLDSRAWIRRWTGGPALRACPSAMQTSQKTAIPLPTTALTPFFSSPSLNTFGSRGTCLRKFCASSGPVAGSSY